MAAEALLGRLADRFPERSEEEIASALKAADFHAGHAARILSRSYSSAASADVSVMSAGGGSSFPPPSPVLAELTPTRSQRSPISAAKAADPLDVALGRATAHAVRPMPSSLFPASPPAEPRPGATGELGGALEPSGAVRLFCV
eukprot:COSAG03_NODE_8099_length_837_cov_1.029810_1_plen_144_part_00